WADCVRSAVTKAAPETRIVAPESLRLAPEANMSLAVSPESGNATGPMAPAIQQVAQKLQAGYLLVVDGITDESVEERGGGYDRALRDTHLYANIWDVRTGKHLGELTVQTMGHTADSWFWGSGLVLDFWQFSPTESTACTAMAAEIRNYLSGKGTTA